MIFSFILRSFSAFSTLLMNLTISFLYDLSLFGSFIKYFSLLTLLSVVLRIGLEKISVRWLSRDLPLELKNYTFTNIINIFLIWSLFVLVFIFLFFDIQYFNFLVCLFFYSFNIVLCNIIRSQGFINISIFLSGVIFPLLIVIFSIYFQYYFSNFLVISLMYISVINFLITCVIFLFISKFKYHPFTFKNINIHNFNELFFSMLFTFTVVGYQTLPVSIGSFFLSEEQIGLFQYSVMFSMLFGLLPLVTYSVFEVSFSRSKNDFSILKIEIIKLEKVQKLFLYLMVPLSFLIYYLLLKNDINILLICTFSLMISQIFNIFTTKYQIFSNMLGDVRVSFFCSLIGLCFFFLSLLFLILSGSLNLTTLSFSVLIAYITKFISFKKLVNINI